MQLGRAGHGTPACLLTRWHPFALPAVPAPQVLSRGGDVAADRLEDTTAEQQQRTNASFLPSAFIMGLQPGSTLDAEVVVVAEDGVTTCRYPLQFLRVEGELTLSVASAPGAAAGMGVFAGANASAAGAWRSPGWPLPPAEQAICSVCPRGWAAGEGEPLAALPGCVGLRAVMHGGLLPALDSPCMPPATPRACSQLDGLPHVPAWHACPRGEHACHTMCLQPASLRCAAPRC